MTNTMQANPDTVGISVTLTGEYMALAGIANDLLKAAITHHEAAYAVGATADDREYHSRRYQAAMDAVQTIHQALP